MKDVVTNINSLNFTINGLTVSNAAVKQTDNKTVVLTTAVQKGGEKYTVTLNEKAIGSFTGISNVLPEKVSMITTSQQGVVGNQVTVRAEVFVGKDESKAGIPVTFNIVSDNKSINKDHVVEIKTNADGIAEYSYTQYAAAEDTVQVYATGNASKRATGMVYWATTAQLTIKDITEGATLANGSKKVYEINSAKNAGKYVFVTFEENLNVAPDKAVRTATVEGLATYTLDGLGKVTGTATFPYNYSTSGTAVTAVKLDATGKANLVVTGSNAKVTPIVFEGAYKTLTGNVDVITDAPAYSATALQAKASTVSFELKHDLGLTLKAEGVQNAATYLGNKETGGRDYTVTYTDKNGKAAAPGTQVLVALPVAGGATFVLDANGNEQAKVNADNLYNYFALTVGSKGQVDFTVASKANNSYVAPIVFINNSNASTTLLDANDLQAQGEITYFVNTVAFAAELSALDAAGKPVSAVVANQETAYFTYSLVDQNGKPRSFSQDTNVAFEVKAGTGAIRVGLDTIEPGNTKTVRATITAGQTSTQVGVYAVTPSSVTVTATGSRAGVVLPSTNPSSVTVNFSQYGTSNVTGPATAVNTALDVFTVGNVLYNYAAGTYKYNGSIITKSAFEGYIAGNTATVSVTVDADGKFTFDVIGTSTGVSTAVDAVNASSTAGQVKSALANYPGYASLPTVIKDAIAQAIATTVTTGSVIYDETTLAAEYETQYVASLNTQIGLVDSAAVTAKSGTPANYTTFVNTVKNIPNSSAVVSKLAAIEGVTLQQAVATKVDAIPTTTLTKAGEIAAEYLVALDKAITDAKADVAAAEAVAPTNAALVALNAATNGPTMLAALKAANTVVSTKTNAEVLGLNLNLLDSTNEGAIAAKFFGLKGSGFTALNSETKFQAAVDYVTDVAGPVVKTAEYDAAAKTITLTFDEAVTFSGTLDNVDLTIGGTTAVAKVKATETAGVVVITLTASTYGDALDAGYDVNQTITITKFSSTSAAITLKDTSAAANNYVAAPFKAVVTTP